MTALAQTPAGLAWPRLMAGRLVKRYKRFLADVRLESGELITAHCPNTGSMKGCSEPGRPVWVSASDDPRRKLKYDWWLIQMPSSLVGVNTSAPNHLVRLAASRGWIPELAAFTQVRAEVKTSSHTRLDLMLEGPEQKPCYIEIKNCTMVERGVAMFPDAVTTRGLKHLDELARLAGQGFGAALFVLVQRMDAESFAPADMIDPAYGKRLREVAGMGVGVLAYDVEIDTQELRLGRRLPVAL